MPFYLFCLTVAPGMKEVTIKDLFANAVQYGHRKSRWNPKMRKFIFAEKNGVHVIDLEKTKDRLDKACTFLANAASQNKKILFVGTKPQVTPIVTAMAKELDAPYISKKWPAGLLTNWSVFSERINYLKTLKAERDAGDWETKKYTKKEIAQFNSEIEKLEKTLGGVENMRGIPDVIFVVDPMKDGLAIKEAKLCKVPVVAIVDTNASPDNVEYVIPANDDAVKSLKYIMSIVKEACATRAAKKDNVKKMEKAE